MTEIDDELLWDVVQVIRMLADDDEAEIAHHYPADLREQYPIYQKKYDRDMATPRHGRFLADSLQRHIDDDWGDA